MKRRYDLTKEDFSKLSRFSRSLAVVKPPEGIRYLYDLGATPMWLPSWYKSGLGWQVSEYECIEQKAIGITLEGFKAICRYLHAEPNELINLLFKAQMISVMPGTQPNEERLFRRDLNAFPQLYPYLGLKEFSEGEIYVIEYRRAVEGFGGAKPKS